MYRITVEINSAPLPKDTSNIKKTYVPATDGTIIGEISQSKSHVEYYTTISGISNGDPVLDNICRLAAATSITFKITCKSYTMLFTKPDDIICHILRYIDQAGQPADLEYQYGQFVRSKTCDFAASSDVKCSTRESETHRLTFKNNLTRHRDNSINYHTISIPYIPCYGRSCGDKTIYNQEEDYDELCGKRVCN